MKFRVLIIIIAICTTFAAGAVHEKPVGFNQDKAEPTEKVIRDSTEELLTLMKSEDFEACVSRMTGRSLERFSSSLENDSIEDFREETPQSWTLGKFHGQYGEGKYGIDVDLELIDEILEVRMLWVESDGVYKLADTVPITGETIDFYEYENEEVLRAKANEIAAIFDHAKIIDLTPYTTAKGREALEKVLASEDEMATLRQIAEAIESWKILFVEFNSRAEAVVTIEFMMKDEGSKELEWQFVKEEGVWLLVRE